MITFTLLNQILEIFENNHKNSICSFEYFNDGSFIIWLFYCDTATAEAVVIGNPNDSVKELINKLSQYTYFSEFIKEYEISRFGIKQKPEYGPLMMLNTFSDGDIAR